MSQRRPLRIECGRCHADWADGHRCADLVTTEEPEGVIAPPESAEEIENLRRWCSAAWRSKTISDSQWDCLRLLANLDSLTTQLRVYREALYDVFGASSWAKAQEVARQALSTDEQGEP